MTDSQSRRTHPETPPEGAVQPTFQQGDTPAHELAKLQYIIAAGYRFVGGEGLKFTLGDEPLMTKADRENAEARIAELLPLVSDEELVAAKANLEVQIKAGDWRAGDPSQKSPAMNRLWSVGYKSEQAGNGPVHIESYLASPNVGKFVTVDGKAVDDEGQLV